MDRWLPRIFPLLNHVKWLTQRFFSHHVQIKTRNPLFPFLFTLVADAFSQILRESEEQTLTKGF